MICAVGARVGGCASRMVRLIWHFPRAPDVKDESRSAGDHGVLSAVGKASDHSALFTPYLNPFLVSTSALRLPALLHLSCERSRDFTGLGDFKSWIHFQEDH